MIERIEGPAWSPLEFPTGFTEDDTHAPVSLPDAPPRAYSVTLALLLEGTEIPAETLQVCMSTAGVFLYGAKHFLEHANRFIELVDTDPAAAVDSLDQLLVCATTLVGERTAAYALRQVSDMVAAQRGANPFGHTCRIRRTRRYIASLEEPLKRSGAPARMEPTEYARLVVAFDEFYDDAYVQLSRLADLVGSHLDDARQQFPEFLRRVYDDFALASFGDNLIAEHAHAEPSVEGAPGEMAESVEGIAARHGLLNLLPELIAALR